jgi:hypothetical protein
MKRLLINAELGCVKNMAEITTIDAIMAVG